MRRLPVLLVTVIPEGSDAKRLDLTDRVLHFEYEDCEDKADALKLTVNNYDLANFDDPVWRKDNLVQVTWGYTDALAPTRTCKVVKVTGFQELSIEAHGMEVALNGRVRNQLFENMKRSDAVRRIALEAGFRSPEVLHIEDTEVVYPAIQQARLTDAQFLRRMAQKEGFEWFIDFDGFHFHRRDVLQRPLRVIEWRDPSGGQPLEVMSINIENDVTAKPGQVTVKSHNPEKRFGLDKKVNNDQDKTRGVLAATVEVKGPAESAVSGQEDIVCSVETHERALKRQAEAKFRKAQQTAVKMSLEMIGDPNLLAKSVVEVRGVGKRLSQRYYVKTVKHTIKDGYKCNVSLISDGSGGHSTKSKVIEGTSAINVGAPTKAKGKQGPPPPRYGLDKGEAAPPAPPALKESKTTDADGEEVTTYHDQRHRDPPPMTSPDDYSDVDEPDEVLVTGDDDLSSPADDFESIDQ